MDYQRGGTQKDIYAPTEVISISCPLCGMDNHKEIYKERGVLGIAQCSSCRLIYVK